MNVILHLKFEIVQFDLVGLHISHFALGAHYNFEDSPWLGMQIF